MNYDNISVVAHVGKGRSKSSDQLRPDNCQWSGKIMPSKSYSTFWYFYGIFLEHQKPFLITSLHISYRQWCVQMSSPSCLLKSNPVQVNIVSITWLIITHHEKGKARMKSHVSDVNLSNLFLFDRFVMYEVMIIIWLLPHHCFCHHQCHANILSMLLHWPCIWKYNASCIILQTSTSNFSQSWLVGCDALWYVALLIYSNHWHVLLLRMMSGRVCVTTWESCLLCPTTHHSQLTSLVLSHTLYSVKWYGFTENNRLASQA